MNCQEIFHYSFSSVCASATWPINLWKASPNVGHGLLPRNIQIWMQKRLTSSPMLRHAEGRSELQQKWCYSARFMNQREDRWTDGRMQIRNGSWNTQRRPNNNTGNRILGIRRNVIHSTHTGTLLPHFQLLGNDSSFTCCNDQTERKEKRVRNQKLDQGTSRRIRSAHDEESAH